MIPVWPSDLPQHFLQEGYSSAFADSRLRTATESGAQKVRRRFSVASRPVSGQFFGYDDDMARLERFYEEETGGGSLPFLIPDQTRNELLITTEDRFLLLSEDGVPILNEAWWLVTFGDNPPQTQVASGPIYRATLALLVLPL